MNKNLFFKILGIISGLLIIAGLFLPYTKQSLWTIDINNKQIYLSIVIIIFALLPIILYTINKKIEFVYASVGALGFFITVQLVDAISKGSFAAFGIGFYFMLVGIILMAIVTLIFLKGTKINVLNEQIAPISNNITDPIERKNMDPTYSQNLDNSLPLENQVENIVSEEIDNSEDVIRPLGDEIPEYQSENKVNPVISEFTTDINIPQETANTQINPTQEVSSVENVVETAPAVESSVEVVSVPVEQPTVIENVPQQQLVSTQPTVENVAPVDARTVVEESTSQESIFATPQQSDILFEDSQQQEIPQESQEPQIDIFGQPK